MKLKFGHLWLTFFLTCCSLFGIGQSKLSEKLMLNRVEFVLSPGGEPLGVAATKLTPEVRIVEVDDFSEAFAMLLRICKSKKIRREKVAGNLYYILTLPEDQGQLVLTDKVKKGTNEVAVLNVMVPDMKVKIKEVRFIK